MSKKEDSEVECKGCGAPMLCDCGEDDDHYCISCISKMSDDEFNELVNKGLPEEKGNLSFRHTMMQQYPGTKPRKIGVNEKCQCGSDKKFKKCCMGKGIYGR